jgi:hypothetical protein
MQAREEAAMTPEQKARVSIDALLVAAGWHVCNVVDANIHASTGVAIREFSLNNGYGFSDYLLYVNGKACGVIEAKKQGSTLTGLELQSNRYAQGLPNSLARGPLVGKHRGGNPLHQRAGLVKPVMYVTSKYLVISFESPMLQWQMVPKGSGLQHIHLDDLRADCVPFPSLAEQVRIVGEVDRNQSIIREVEAEVDANLQRAQALRQATLAKAFGFHH